MMSFRGLITLNLHFYCSLLLKATIGDVVLIRITVWRLFIFYSGCVGKQSIYSVIMSTKSSYPFTCNERRIKGNVNFTFKCTLDAHFPMLSRETNSVHPSQSKWPVTSKYYETPTHAIRKSFHAKGSTRAVLSCYITNCSVSVIDKNCRCKITCFIALLASCAAAACHFHIVRCHWVYRPALTWINISKEWALQVTFVLHKDAQIDSDRFLHFSESNIRPYPLYHYHLCIIINIDSDKRKVSD